MTFQEMEQELGYTCITTFWDVFAIADRFGKNAIIDTCNRAFQEWKDDYKYLTELVLVLNHRCWFHYNNGREDIAMLYSELYSNINNWALDNLKDEAAEYYFNVLD